MKKLILQAGLLILVLLIISTKSSLSIFIDTTALFFVLLTTVLAIFSRHSFTEIKVMNEETFNTIFTGSYAGAGLSSVFALVTNLQTASVAKQLGPTIATCLLSLFYSLILTMMAYFASEKKSTQVVYASLATVAIVVGICILTVWSAD